MKTTYKILVTSLCALVPNLTAMEPQSVIVPQRTSVILFNMSRALTKFAAEGNEKGAIALVQRYPGTALLNYRDANGKTALTYAREKGMTELAQLLESRGAKA